MRCWGTQSIEKADALAIPENIDMRANITPLVDDAIENPGRTPPERGQRVAYREARLIDFQHSLPIH